MTTPHHSPTNVLRNWEERDSYGPFGFLNPTTRRYSLPPPVRKEEREERRTGEEGEEEENAVPKENEDSTGKEDEVRVDEVWRLFRTRDNRKGRHALEIIPNPTGQFLTPPPTSTLKATLSQILAMFTSFPYYDISYLVAIIFTLGSIVWVINAFFVWLPLQVPSSEFPGEIANAGGITAFIGATIFEIGSVLLMIEAVNEKRGDCFGWAVEEVWEEINGVREKNIRVERGECAHHHKNKKNFVGKGKKVESEIQETLVKKEGELKEKVRNWTWWPSWKEMKTHYLREVGFLACLSQMFGATIFWISGFTALPPIYSQLTSTAAQNGAYWLPQVIGGTGFIVSGTLFMLETQTKWYIPAWDVLGWHIGAWNLVGGIGFTLCGALGFGAANSGCVYQGSLATFWGSWCFLTGSVIQWYESLDKHPVGVQKGDGGQKREKDVEKGN